MLEKEQLLGRETTSLTTAARLSITLFVLNVESLDGAKQRIVKVFLEFFCVM